MGDVVDGGPLGRDDRRIGDGVGDLIHIFVVPAPAALRRDLPGDEGDFLAQLEIGSQIRDDGGQPPPVSLLSRPSLPEEEHLAKATAVARSITEIYLLFSELCLMKEWCPGSTDPGQFDENYSPSRTDYAYN